jgi:superfamily I DNA and/or RNA helicase/very-short-patch-repair endonuclease
MDVNSDQSERSSSPLSPEFLAGGTEAGLEKIRTRLLDLTNRNRLLNFRHTNASSLRVVSANLSETFRRLVDGGKLAFLPVPDREIPFADTVQERGAAKEASQPKPSVADYAKGLGWDISYDLEDKSYEMGRSDALPVLYDFEGLQTITRKIGSVAKTAIEESGTNMLYLILGFLEWYESDDSQQPRYAPLVTVPVALDRGGAKGKGFECSLEYTGEDLTTNFSLVEKMRRDFALDIPTLQDEDSPASYYALFSSILNQKRRWRIRQQITLSFLSFGKLLMYRDLDPKAWPGISQHKLVRELFEGNKSSPIGHAEEFPIDDPELKPEVPPLIVDADSSQHSALIHALRGQNLVIEGPPGTGKSQTITNLIAAALVKGKTVLFVAEKLAALEVVRRRLDETGLGQFCLELHSHKTKKNLLLSDLANRIKAHGSFREPKELDQHLGTVEETKRILTSYARLLNTPAGPFQATAFDVIWARDRFYRELPFKRELSGQVANVTTYTPAQYAKKEQFLSLYGRQITSVLETCNTLGEHPWTWVSRALTFEEEEQIVDRLESFLQVLKDSIDGQRKLLDAVDISLDETIGGIKRSRSLLNALPDAGDALNKSLLEPLREAEVRAALQDFVRDAGNGAFALRMLEASTVQPESLFLSNVMQGFAEAFETIRAQELGHCTFWQLRDRLESRKAAEMSLGEAETCFAGLQTYLGCQTCFDSLGAESILNSLRLIECAPLDVLHLRAQSLETNSAGQIVRDAAEEAHSLRTKREELGSVFDLSLATTISNPSQLDEHAAALEEARVLQVWFGRAYKLAKRTYRRIALGGADASRTTMSRNLRALADYCLRRARFEGNALYRDTLGPHYAGVDSKWEQLRSLTSWYAEVFTLLPEHTPHTAAVRDLLLRSRTEGLRAVNSTLSSYARHRVVLEQLGSKITKATDFLSFNLRTWHTISELLQQLRTANAQLDEAVRSLTSAGLRDDAHVGSIPDLLLAADRYRTNVERVSTNDSARKVLGAQFNGIKTDIGPIGQAIAFAETLARGPLSQKACAWLLCDDYAARLKQLGVWLTHVATSADRLLDLGREIDALAESNCWPVDEKESLGYLITKCQRALANRDELPKWVHFVRRRVESQEAGLAKLTSLADSGAMDPQHLVAAFRFLFYDSLARGLFADQQDLSQFTGLTQEEARKQFACSDRIAIRLYRERAASIIACRPVPHGNQSGPVGTWTDAALLIHEINKQKRHLPIRQLVRRAGNALQALKPCFMMGPLSVAQYLAPGEMQFDLVIMDEASQLKPEDAIGAISRGGQIVIVGDPKQLPPTNFFQRVMEDSEDDDEEDSRTVVEEGESILDVASTLYQPVRRLRWHYRSRHHSLIAFSNHEFYQGDLVVFPSAYHEDPSLGIKYHAVSGIFENRRNAKEADLVVQAVIEHMQNRPEESLGVVTLNFEQRELIEELLDERLRTDPFTLAYQERMNAGPEPFFVKNLENVQGDERDVIFISVTYGPDAKGNQYLRFGPINGANGQRRLNVLFTRAKRRIEVFSSLDPERIPTTGTSAGVRVLKEYLGYARTGILEVPNDGGAQPTNDFERSIGSVLKEKGYDVVPQVGVAGFFIDLAVRHPIKPGTFMLGIECDGASYHSGRSARDRDRLRQEILENLGWRIYRIWSTDWFKSRGTEVDRLLKHIDSMLAIDPDYLKEQEKKKRAEALRQKLIELRENDIKTAFPDCSSENGLLRDELLDEFISGEPTTQGDWFRLVSHELRSKTDSRQVGQFLPRVLAIIEDSSE